MQNAERVRQRVRFSGRVQGVGFRMTTLSQAKGLDVHGFVRNEADGSVLLDVEGPQEAVNELLGRIQRAMHDNIEDTQIDHREPKGQNGFHIA